MNLLIIRPQPGADATAARVRAAGHQAIVMPLFEVQPVTCDLPAVEGFDALLLTSGNAVRQAGDKLDVLGSLPVIAVGSATARAVEQKGLSAAITGKTGVTDVLAVAHAAGHRRLLWLAGEDRVAGFVPDEMTIDVLDVYRNVALPAPENFLQAVLQAHTVLLHSPRAAAHFAALCDIEAINRATIKLAALSNGIAARAGDGWKSIIVASAPSDNILLAQLE